MKIILDCDPGHDDAIALMLLGCGNFDVRFEVLGITTVSGNQTIEKTTANALNVISYLGLPFKVYRGASRPLVKEPEICEEIHGKSGLDGFVFPPHDLRAEEESAADFIVRAALSSDEKITVVTTGPMTNLATALKRAPSIKEKIARIVLMGGSVGAGNVTPAAEFNIHCDPEAAEICFTSGLPVYMVGLDVTRRVLVLQKIVERMEKVGGKAAKMFAALMQTFNENQRKVFGLEGGPLHDPVTVAWLLDNDLLTFAHVNTEIDTYPGCSYGRTNCDLPDYLHKEKNSFVAVDIDVERFWGIIEKALAFYH